MNKEKKETDLVWDSDREGNDQKQRTPVEIALLAGRVEVLALLAEFTELPESQKLEYLRLMMESDREVSLEEFKKQIQSLPLEKVSNNIFKPKVGLKLSLAVDKVNSNFLFEALRQSYSSLS